MVLGLENEGQLLEAVMDKMEHNYHYFANYDLVKLRKYHCIFTIDETAFTFQAHILACTTSFLTVLCVLEIAAFQIFKILCFFHVFTSKGHFSESYLYSP